MLPRTTKQLLQAIAIALLFLAAPAQAQGLGIGVDLGGLGGVDLDVGGGNGVDLDVDLGDDDLLDLELGGSSSADLDLGLGRGGLDSVLGSAPPPLTQEAALQAVRRGRALPLDEIMLRAALITDGQIIDAQLIAVQDVLLYELKVLGKGGKVSDLYFYARSGLPVE